MDNFEHDTVTLMLDNDEQVECGIIGIFEADDRQYIALLPLDDESGEVYLYRYSENESGEPDLSNIESDEEYEIVSDAFDEFLDKSEYDELYYDEDEDSDENDE